MGRLSNFHRIFVGILFSDLALFAANAQQHSSCSSDMVNLLGKGGGGACQPSEDKEAKAKAEAEADFISAAGPRCPYQYISRLTRDKTDRAWLGWKVPHPSFTHTVRIPSATLDQDADNAIAKLNAFKAKFKSKAPTDADRKNLIASIPFGDEKKWVGPAIQNFLKDAQERTGAEAAADKKLKHTQFVDAYYNAYSQNQGILDAFRRDPKNAKLPGRDVQRENFPFANFMDSALDTTALMTPLSQQCRHDLNSKFKDPKKLEAFLAKNPATHIPGLENPSFLNKCIDACLTADPRVCKIGKGGISVDDRMAIITDYYFTMARLRDTWQENHKKVKETAFYLGHKADEGIPKAPGVKKESDPCNGDPQGSLKLAKEWSDRLQNLDQEAAKSAQLGGISIDQAKVNILQEIQYRSDPGVKSALDRVLTEKGKGKISEGATKQLGEAFRTAITEDYNTAKKKLESAQKISKCLGSFDQNCFSQKWDAFGGPVEPEHASALLEGMNEFDFSKLYSSTANMRKGSDKDFVRDAISRLSDSECMETGRETFNRGLNAQNDIAFILGTAYLPPIFRMKAFGVAAGKAAPALTRANAAIRGLVEVASGGKILMAEKTFEASTKINLFGLMSRFGSPGMRMASANASFVVDGVWLASTVPMVAKHCGPIVERAEKRIENHLKSLAGCQTDPMMEAAAQTEYLGCAVTVVMGLFQKHMMFNAKTKVKVPVSEENPEGVRVIEGKTDWKRLRRTSPPVADFNRKVLKPIDQKIEKVIAPVTKPVGKAGEAVKKAIKKKVVESLPKRNVPPNGENGPSASSGTPLPGE